VKILLFLKKKKQKDFAPKVPGCRERAATTAPEGKSFLVLFLKKEPLSPTPSPAPPSVQAKR
jgi:hypothetical protein